MRLSAVVFVCGAVVMMLEILGSRLIAPYYGDSLFVWTSLIGVVLASLSYGYYYGGKVADNNASIDKLSLYILYSGILVSTVPFLSNKIEIFGLVFGLKYGPLLSSILLLAAPSFFLGIVSPYAVKLEAKAMHNVGSITGNLYAISTVGSIAGTLATGFILIPLFRVKTILFFLSLALIAIALYCGGRKAIKTALIGFIVALVVASIALKENNQDTGDAKIVYQTDTPYHQITVLDYNSTNMRVMSQGAGSIMGNIYLNSNKTAYTVADVFHLAFVLKPDIKKVLFLGCGAGVGPKQFHDYYNDVTVDVVDIDSEVNEVAKKYFNLTEDERLKLHATDARMYLKQSDKTYDLIVVDIYTSSLSSIPFHITTQEMVEEINRHLSGDGVAAMNIVSGAEGKRSEIMRAEYKTYSQVFPNVYVFRVDNASLEDIQNVILMASKSGKHYSREEFIKAAENTSSRIPIKEYVEYARLYYDKKIPTDDVPVLEDDYAPVDSLMVPVMGSLKDNIRLPEPKVCFSSGECVKVEAVSKPEELYRGLMYRDGLEAGWGMLFIFQQEDYYGFWMKNMKFPIDMIWINSANRIVHIETNVPPCVEDPCRSYAPKDKARYVLEVEANYTLKENIKVGDTIKIIDIKY